MKTYIIDKTGYVIDEFDYDYTPEEGDFMYPHTLAIGKNGGEYAYCNGYNIVDTNEPDVCDCEIAMMHGMDCQCGKHQDRLAYGR
jgi:hypothetical protein